jgi:hypothetical protein
LEKMHLMVLDLLRPLRHIALLTYFARTYSKETLEGRNARRGQPAFKEGANAGGELTGTQGLYFEAHASRHPGRCESGSDREERFQ